jgi:hypothetical protein
MDPFGFLLKATNWTTTIKILENKFVVVVYVLVFNNKF